MKPRDQTSYDVWLRHKRKRSTRRRRRTEFHKLPRNIDVKPLNIKSQTKGGGHRVSPECDLRCQNRVSWYDDRQQGTQGLKGEEGARGEWHEPDGRGAGDDVGAGAEPAPARPDQRGDPAAEAAAAHAQEPWLRGQLPGQAGHAEGGAGEAEGGATAGSREAGLGECQHEGGARCPALQIRSLAELRQDSHPQPRGPLPGTHCLCHRAPHPRQSGHHQRHHNSQVKNRRQVLVSGRA